MNRAQRRKLGKRPMFQANVTERREDGKEYQVPVGPRMDNAEPIAQFCEAINKAVALGKEKRWSNARVEKVNQIEEHA
jgi:hypothetical protein